MNIGDVQVLVEAVKAGSLAAAARRLGVTPMLASRRLAALERELGVRLVQRTTRALAPTPEGDAFLPFAQAMVEDEANGRAAVRPASAGASGMLRITASMPFGRKVVSQMIPAFMQANPELHVDLLLTDSVVDIVAEGIDVAVRIAMLRDNMLVAKRLAPNPRTLYASPAYVAAHGAPRSIGDLGHHQCLLITGTTHWQFRAAAKLVRQRVAGRFTASSVEALHQACLGGLGIAMRSTWDVVEEIADGRLVELPLTDAAPEELSVWAVHPSARFVAPKVRLFIDALERHLRTCR
jgi:DNA-binding transcriptional LysR family regulator